MREEFSKKTNPADLIPLERTQSARGGVGCHKRKPYCAPVQDHGFGSTITAALRLIFAVNTQQGNNMMRTTDRCMSLPPLLSPSVPLVGCVASLPSSLIDGREHVVPMAAGKREKSRSNE